MSLQVNVLGPLRIERGGEEIPVERPAQRRLLSILALADGSRVPTDRLIEQFWGDGAPETARAALQTHISGLRRTGGDHLIATEGYGYRLNLGDHELDVRAFSELATNAKVRSAQGDWAATLEQITQALDLWQGAPFEELIDDDFARATIARLDEQHVELLELRAEALLAQDRPADALPDLEGLVIQHPYRERLWEHLMTARYRLGRNAEALQAFQTLASHLAEIGVEPSEPLRRLEERILFHDQTLAPLRHNLPSSLDEFIGRSFEHAEIAELLSANRHVSLVGAGGSGKTRLAIEVARSVLDQFEDGVYFVPLADIEDPNVITSLLAQQIGLVNQADDVEKVVERILADQVTLLVFDNCEHLVDSVAELVGRLLRGAPRLKVLSTSREPIRVPGEVVYEVPGLALPTEATKAAESDSVRLFLARAENARPGFAQSADPTLVVRICERLDGMPLAIELAARRAGVIALDDLDSRLEESSTVLAQGDRVGPARHRTLAATIDWSYRLLAPKEQLALASLSVFRGGFSLSMAERVLGEDAASLVLSLADRSLVQTYVGDLEQHRLRLLETIRQYARDRLVELDPEETFRHRHAEWCAEFSDQTWRRMFAPGRDQFVPEIHEEFDNLSAAYEWATQTGRSDLAGRIAQGLHWHWSMLGRGGLSLGYATQALEACGDVKTKLDIRARRAWQYFGSGDLDQAVADSAYAYEAYRDLPNSPLKVYATSSYAHIHSLHPQLDSTQGVHLAEEAVEIAREISDEYATASAEIQLAASLAWAGLIPEAIDQLDSALATAESTGDPILVAHAYTMATDIVMQSAEHRRAGLAKYTELLSQWGSEHPTVRYWMRSSWLVWAMIQRGHFERVAPTLDADSINYHLEGFDRIGDLVTRATASWMQGDLDAALEALRQCEQVGVNPRWNHDFYPLKADVLADLGQLSKLEETVEIYLSTDTDSIEEAMKLGVLNPQVRALVNEALEGGASASDHADDAHRALLRMEQILEDHPRPMTGSVAMETPATHLAFARAELSRLQGSNPEDWLRAVDSADFLYFRIYAQIRLGEALRNSGQAEPGSLELTTGLDEARRVGATRLMDLAQRLLSD